ncbi:MAG: tRNA (N(6)-L-threonylcarbamoyladenosine(37)-C(2))-methylthiotransferase MtaB [Christensenellales bacterium]|jgi:threonylcarbamoyladenosine tRNA methylthiotransferase MtaB
MNRKTISAYTLGCKVNQYDTSAMLEEFIRHGYDVLPFGEKTDVVIVNTCTVTGTGDNKSLKTIRRCARENPDVSIIAAGCLAQREAQEVAQMANVRLVMGTKRREGVALALEKAVMSGETVIAVEGLEDAEFENVQVDSAEGRTRAILKIQEGCKNRCSYCAIPLARGPVRSRGIDSIRSEVKRLCEKGFSEIVLTGIHLNSYGLDSGLTMTDAVIAALESAGEKSRLRLGSLEPGGHYGEFCQSIIKKDLEKKLCPQFHLSLQSGSDGVLGRMKRRYTTDIYRQSVEDLRRHFPGCAITTDIIAGFPGETQDEFEETLSFIKEIGFARVHAFPYSERSGTPAAAMAGQLPVHIRQQRAGQVIKAAGEAAESFMQSKLGQRLEVIFEEQRGELARGYCQHYLRCEAKNAPIGEIIGFAAKEIKGGVIIGELL